MVQELKATTERQAATIALQQGQIRALTASLKQQTETITAKLEATDKQQQKQIEALTTGLQKVSAQLEMSKPATQTVLNDE
jgi:erythromycin esterase-like protein